jgi:hypothetical protein
MTLPLLSTARLTFLPSGVEAIARLLSRSSFAAKALILSGFNLRTASKGVIWLDC